MTAHILAQLAVPALGLIGFGRLFLADEGASHGLTFAMLALGFAGKVWLSI
jgi:hypothetical protein